MLKIEWTSRDPAILLRNLLDDIIFDEHMAEAEWYIKSGRSNKNQKLYIEVMLAYRNDDYPTMKGLIKFNSFPPSVRSEMEKLYMKGFNKLHLQNNQPLLSPEASKIELAYQSTKQDPAEAYWDVAFQNRTPRMNYDFLAEDTGRTKEEVSKYMNKKHQDEYKRRNDPVLLSFIAEFERYGNENTGNEDRGDQPSTPEDAPALRSRKRCQNVKASERSKRQPRKQKKLEKVIDQVPPSRGDWISNGAQTDGSESPYPLENAPSDDGNQTVDSVSRSLLEDASLHHRRSESGLQELAPEPEPENDGALEAPLDSFSDDVGNESRSQEAWEVLQSPPRVDDSQFDSYPGSLPFDGGLQNLDFYQMLEFARVNDVGAYGAQFDDYVNGGNEHGAHELAPEHYGAQIDVFSGRSARGDTSYPYLAQPRREVKIEPVDADEGLEVTYASFGDPSATSTKVTKDHFGTSIQEEPASLPPRPTPLPTVENGGASSSRIGADYGQLALGSAVKDEDMVRPPIDTPIQDENDPLSQLPAPTLAPPTPPQRAPLSAVGNGEVPPPRIGENYMLWSIAEMADWVYDVTKSEKCRSIIIEGEFDGTSMKDIATDGDLQKKAQFPFWTYGKLKKAAEQMYNHLNGRRISRVFHEF